MRQKLWHFFILGWKNTKDFTSRSSRRELGFYVLATIVFTITLFALVMVTLAIGELILQGQLSRALIVPSILISIAFLCIFLIPIFSLMIRRCHDNNINGYWITLLLGLFIGMMAASLKTGQLPILILQGMTLLIVIFLLIKKGQQVNNKYGPPPKKADHTNDGSEKNLKKPSTLNNV
jgi:uncharacterized membrane protein YhaH (DUF805 family)